MIKRLLFSCALFYGSLLHAQLKWVNVDSLYQPLPKTVHVYKTNDSLDSKPNIAFYVIADLKDKHLKFTADTTRDRRITPINFFERNNKALVVVNCTFFSYETNRSLNTVIIDGKLVGYNIHSIRGSGIDSIAYYHPVRSAIGISKRRNPDIAWVYTDSSKRHPIAFERKLYQLASSSSPKVSLTQIHPAFIDALSLRAFGIKRWKMQTAVGGGPALLQDREIRITNEEEHMFTGKAINDKHPRTAMGYTKDNKLIILVIQGRFPGIAEGATLTQEAQIFKDLGCREALNLDGGGSSCMLVNGKETIKPSDKEGQRPVPAAFLIKVNQ